MKWENSIVTKFTVLYLIIVLLMSGAAIVVVNNAAQDAARGAIRYNLQNSAGIMATQVNATQVLLFAPGDEGSPEYIAMAHQLESMRSNNDFITNAYIMKVDDDQRIEFVVDDFWLGDPNQSALIGEVYDSPDKDEIFMALSVPTASRDIYTDKWGTFVSGYAPVRDSNGNTVAVLGIDVEASRLVASSKGFGNILIGTFLIFVIAGGIVVFLYSRSIAGNISRLTRDVQKIKDGERMVEIDTSGKDEIGELAGYIAGLEETLKD
ncbi:MAG TPA: methyl-accepting chemotaxis protein [Methanoregulaceae archaeon]|nr:methyl-accepting chemotaxis protein [Methanoregulaceae archaeon]